MAADGQAVRAPRLSLRAAASWTPLIWTALALGGGVLLHADRAPLWATAVAIVFIAWRLVAGRGVVRLPGKLARALIAFALVGAVLANYHTLNGLTPGTALLVLMAAVKLLETHSRRDQYIVVGGVLFLLLAACLDRQNLLRTPFYLAEVWVCCAAFAVIGYTPDRRGAASVSVAPFDNRAAVLLAGRALLYAIPLAVVLFMFFPRLPGAFWSLPRSGEAETGLGDTMSPGSISQLTSSYDIAFRVVFDGRPPPPTERYWRGPVLHDFDGYTWKRRPGATYQTQPIATGSPSNPANSAGGSRSTRWITLRTRTFFLRMTMSSSPVTR
jgi:protein-glutamine gamma-glutamyltransferase